ncbi:TonB-dependent receptor domain-containing protein [Roseateles sp. BYS180W]|uniref:TonB-dependent receptor domain-containing protein n=1 Tax=Roseateles rivi TaxID=3299028 RepID=A0ABW7FTH6_9BURK
MNSKPRTRHLRLSPVHLAVLALAPWVLWAPPVWAQASTAPTQAAQGLQSFDIAAGPLAQALAQFTQQSRLSFSVDAQLLQGRNSPGLRGTHTPRQALEALLVGSGLTLQSGAQGVLTLVPEPSAAGARRLGPLRVQGAGGALFQGPALHGSSEQSAQEVYTEARSSVALNRQHVERFRGTSPADILRGQPGIQVGDARNGHALDVNVRGLQGQGRVPVVVDGTVQFLEVSRGYTGTQTRSYLDPDLVGQLQVQKGPGLDLGAAGAIGGVVQVQTLQASDILAEGQNQGVRLRMGLADNTREPTSGFRTVPRRAPAPIWQLDNHHLSVAAAWRTPQWEALAAVVHREAGNYFAGEKGAQRYLTAQRKPDGTGLSSTPVAKLFRAGDEVLNTHSRSDSLLLKGGWRPTQDHALELSWRHTRARHAEIMASAIMRTPEPEPGSGTVYAEAPNTMYQFEPGRMRQNALSLQHRWQPVGQSLLDLRSTVWATRSDTLMWNAPAGSTPTLVAVPISGLGDPQGDTYQWALRSELRNSRVGAQVGNTSRLFVGTQEFTFNYGLDYQHERLGPGRAMPRTEVDLRNNRFYRYGERREFSALASVKWQPNEHWALQLGGRYQSVNVQDFNRNATATAWAQRPVRAAMLTKDGKPLANGYVYWLPDAKGQFTEASLRASPHRRGVAGDLDWNGFKPFGSFQLKEASAWRWSEPLRATAKRFTPQASVSFKPDEHSQLYARYAEGLRAPALAEATLGHPFAVPTAGTRAEHSHSWELGTSTQRSNFLAQGDRAAFKAAYFNNRVDDYITRTFDPQTYAYTIRNVDRFDTAGWEFQASWGHRSGFVELGGTRHLSARTCDLKMATALRANDATAQTPDCVDGGFGAAYTNTQNPPKYSASATLGLHLLAQRLTLGTRVLHHSRPLTRLTQPWHLAAYTTVQQYYLPTTTVDLFASAKLSPAAQLNVQLDNATDRYHLDALAQSPMPAPGRTLRVDLSLSF